MQITDETVHKRTISATLSESDFKQLIAEAVAKRAGLTLHAWHERTVVFTETRPLGLEALVTITIDHQAPTTVATEKAA